MTPTLGVYAMTRPASQLAADDTGDWRARAACRSHQDLFFGPEKEPTPAKRRREADAVDICQGQCPVRAQCLADALQAEGDGSVQHRFGVFGGMTPPQRYALANGRPVPKLWRPAPPRPTPAAPIVDPREDVRPADCPNPTEAGTLRHRKAGERPCAACSAAKVAANKARRVAARTGTPKINPTVRHLKPRPDTDCPDPSEGGALKHYRRGEQPCTGCAAAKAKALRDRRAATRAANDQQAVSA